ncbi:lipopolysaccharide biosynthesis protein [Aquihabitans daechungensis]|uniref:lipopolysaccharide biosynthesis protein n=1 Tax=Aquihabitans daechungensis TaxID=1052257 RepID=UPI003BA22BBB
MSDDERASEQEPARPPQMASSPSPSDRTGLAAGRPSRVRRVLATATSLRAADHDLTTETGRSAERYRRAALASWVSIGGRLINTAVLFLAIRIVAGSMTSDALGLWLLLVGAVALVGFADLGIGNGLLNVIADAHGREDRKLIRQAIASAFVALTGLAVVLGGLYAAFGREVAWATVLNVTGPSADETTAAVTAFVFCLLISLPLGISQRVHHAHQDGWIANGWLALGSVFSLIGMIATEVADAGIALRVGAMLIGPPIAYLLDTIYLFGFRRRDLRPRWANITRTATGRVLRQGAMFFVLATVGAAAYELDSLVISHYLGASEVELYAIPFRLFALAPSLVLILVMPLWPAYGEAIARDDMPWVHRTLRRSVRLGAAITVPASLVLIVLGPVIIRIWVGERIDPPVSVLAGIGAWAIINGVSTALAAFFNGAGILRLQVVIAVVMATANLALSIVLVQEVGVAGPIWATVITQVVFGLIPAWFLLRRAIGRHSDAEHLRSFIARWGDDRSAPALSEGSVA